MRKNIFALSFIISLTLLLTSCSLNQLTLGLSDRMFNDELSDDKHNLIETIYGEDNWYESILYSGTKYYIDEHEIFSVTDIWRANDEGDVLLSWNGLRFGYIDCYYSYADDAPMFIYETRLGYTYFREDYDFNADVFVIEGTAIELPLSEIVSLEDETFDDPTPSPAKTTKITLVSKTHSRIEIIVSLYKSGESWYSCVGNWPYYPMKLSEDIVQKLTDNNIIG